MAYPARPRDDIPGVEIRAEDGSVITMHGGAEAVRHGRDTGAFAHPRCGPPAEREQISSQTWTSIGLLVARSPNYGTYARGLALVQQLGIAPASSRSPVYHPSAAPAPNVCSTDWGIPCQLEFVHVW